MPNWKGRLAVKVDGQPDQSFASSFELTGSATAGALNLFSPLGTTLAQLTWLPGVASLQRADVDSTTPVQKYASLPTLIQAYTGNDIPVAALFDWLGGVNAAVPGWEADLTRFEQGRIVARRLLPATELRVVLDRPSPL